MNACDGGGRENVYFITITMLQKHDKIVQHTWMDLDTLHCTHISKPKTHFATNESEPYQALKIQWHLGTKYTIYIWEIKWPLSHTNHTTK